MHQYSRVRIFLLVVFSLVGLDIALSMSSPTSVQPEWLLYLSNVPRGSLSGVALAVVIMVLWRVNALEWRSRQKQRFLEERERQLRTITSSARDAIIMMDSRGIVSFWNEAATRIFGYRRGEAVGHGIDQLIVPKQHRAAFWKGLPRFQEAGAAVNQTLELTATHKQGDAIPIELSLAGVQMGDQWHGVVIIRDVTERKEAEATLRFRLEAEQVVNEIFTRLLVLSAGECHDVYCDALAVVGRFVQADRGSIFMLSEDATRVDRCCYWTQEAPSCDGSESLACDGLPWLLDELAEGDVVRVANVDALPNEPKRELGALDVPSTGALLIAPLAIGGDLRGLMSLHWPYPLDSWRDEYVALVKTVAFIFTGTAARVQATEARRAAHAELTQIFNAAVPLCLIGREMSVLRVNDPFCDFFGVERDTVVGRTCQEMWGDASCRALESVIEQIDQGQARVEYEEDRQRCDGSLVSCVITATPYRRGNGKLLGVVTSLTDITDRKRAEQETHDYAMALESANQALEQFNEMANAAARAKSDFLANMSHEIRTPMTAILGFAEILRDPKLTGDDRKNAVDTILRNGQHLLQLINDILDLSKIESGKMVLEQIACMPIEIARDVVSLLSLRAEAKNLSLALKFDGPVPETIQSDPTRLRQVLINLVANAIKFTDAGGVRLVVSLAEEDGQPWLQWEVVDSGIGMTAEQVAHIFDPFTQADATVTRKYGGTGLGLAISRRMVQAMAGTLTVESTPNLGSCFRVAVPLKSLDGVPLVENPGEWNSDADKPHADEAAHRTIAARILLAEDGPDNQALISFLLKRAGAEVEIAEDGLVACEKVAEAQRDGRSFDLILMDMQMPRLDGYTATARLRSDGFSRPIIALTAHAMADDRQKCLEAGCDDFATKPIQRADLLALVARHLHSLAPIDSNSPQACG